jgi:hypothetical protein
MDVEYEDEKKLEIMIYRTGAKYLFSKWNNK